MATPPQAVPQKKGPVRTRPLCPPLSHTQPLGVSFVLPEAQLELEPTESEGTSSPKKPAKPPIPPSLGLRSARCIH
ncbi:hypothetical protein HPB50_002353 [Hyalomma asiaticum]|uniref:Uncharacterized protein n=1 Tax=Hyalomma asiaticum TaxID=266040 RepID=A0ACB7TDL8_HYAAI|nr:hypothetical protein HPB50_002353 [Hyalomma asiaticum]